jgi:alpha-tubulin suppressor-like RCC1 family protein
MGRRIFLAGLVSVAVCGVSALPASASTPTPTITKFKPTSAVVGNEVTITGTNLAGATKVTFNGKKATVISDTAKKIEADVPIGATTGYVVVTTPGGTATSASRLKVLAPLTDAKSVTSDGDSQDGNGYCAVLTSAGVVCWGYGASGELGDGKFYTTGNDGSAVPVHVVGAGGTGTLTGVADLASDADGSYCALLTSGEVDCWGFGYYGELGDGQFYTTGNDGSAIPVQVVGVGGTGTLTGVANLTNGGDDYCAVLTSGGVDCWGYGYDGELGNAQFYTTGNVGSAVPVQVVGVDGTGTLTGVADLSSDSGGYCALLTSGGVDCWGKGYYGQLGDGQFYTTGNIGSAVPVQVVSVSGTGTVTGVASLTSGGAGYCAVLTSGGVDCWGYGYYGELGDGQFYTTGNDGSAVPVQVVGVGGTGTLTGAAKISADGNGSYCVVVTSRGVDCWGYGYNGQLGNGQFYTSGDNGSAVPVQVEGISGTGTLTGAAKIDADGDNGYCAVLTSGAVDCWGFGEDGELGDGQFYYTGNDGSAVPVQVEGIGGTGTLTGTAELSSVGDGLCAVLTSSRVVCWGYGAKGQLGDGEFYTTGFLGSAGPVKVG